MSEKIRNVWWKTRGVIVTVMLFSPITIIDALTKVLLILVQSMISGIIVKACWNLVLINMFNVQRITLLQSFILTFVITCIRLNYINDLKDEYLRFKEKVSTLSKNKKIIDSSSAILSIIVELVIITIATIVVMYSWNNIIPQLLNRELVQINFVQAFGFAYLFNLLLGIKNQEFLKLDF